MKINDKNLVSFATSRSHIDKEGWLGKRGEVNRSFQRRWFILKGNLLFYFEKREDKEPVGLVILEGCTVELAEDEAACAFKLVFHGAGSRAYVLCASDQQDMEQWMKAIASAGYDYVKLMVGELQRQLDEAVEIENQVLTSVSRAFQPANPSDGCLFGHGNGRAPRVNPFDKDLVTDNGTSLVVAPENDLLQQGTSNSRGQRSRYLFIELHEYYGQIFRRLFDEQKKKRAAAQPKQEQNLITF